MKLLAKAAVAASTLALVAVASPGVAATSPYSQSVGGLECDGQVLDDNAPDGGTLYVKVAGQEQRLSSKHFRTYKIVTVLIAQEKTYNGTWKNVASAAPATGKLARAVYNGTTNISKFSWSANTNPELAVTVAGQDDLFRGVVVTKLYDDEGVKIKQLINYAPGQCRL